MTCFIIILGANVLMFQDNYSDYHIFMNLSLKYKLILRYIDLLLIVNLLVIKVKVKMKIAMEPSHENYSINISFYTQW